MVVLAAAGGIIGFLVAASGMAYRIFAAWVVAVLALWTLLQFVLHVRYPWFWVSVAALSVWINGYIATNLEGDG